MADQYAKKLIDQSIGGLNGDYPSQETVCSLIKDTEDILFISPCSLDWNWMYGRVMPVSYTHLQRQTQARAGRRQISESLARR